jgi:hypothetical protein
VDGDKKCVQNFGGDVSLKAAALKMKKKMEQ